MITTLMCFSILSIICSGCIGIVNSHNEIIDTNYKSTIMSYKVEGGLEIVHSKVLEEVKKAIEKSLIDNDPKNCFKNYFLTNNKTEFITNIENINTDNIEVNIINDKIYLENENIRFDVTCNSKINNMKKTGRCSFKININFDFNDINLKEVVTKYNYQEI